MNHDPLADLEPTPGEGMGLFGVESPAAAVPDRAGSAPAPVEEPAPGVAEDAVLRLDSCLTVAEVGELGGQLLGVFDGGSDLALDGSGIEQIDGAGVQLLAALMKEAALQQVSVSWTGSSPELREAAAQLGLSELLHLQPPE